VPDWLLLGVHWLHVLFGIFWFGTVLFTRLVLFPALRGLGPGIEGEVRRSLVEGSSRRLTVIAATGTVALGVARGFLTGALTSPTSVYGLTYLAAAGVGIVMYVWIVSPWLKTPLAAKAYVAGFPVMFTLMVLMRFGY